MGKSHLLVLALGLACSVPAGGVLAQNLPDYSNGSGGFTQSQNLPPLQGRVVTAPAGSVVMASFGSAVSSEYARVGDRFTATLGNDLAAGGSVILPAGSQLEAQVISVTSAGRTGRNGSLDVRFTSALMPNGQRVPLYAKIQTEDGTGVIKGGTAKGRVGKAALRTGAGAAAGALLGTALGPLSGGGVGRGAIYGTAVGAGGGLLYSAFKKGEAAEIPAGQPLTLVLDQPLTVTPDAFQSQQNYQQPQYAQPGYQPQYQQPAYPPQNYQQNYQQQPYNNTYPGQ